MPCQIGISRRCDRRILSVVFNNNHYYLKGFAGNSDSGMHFAHDHLQPIQAGMMRPHRLELR